MQALLNFGSELVFLLGSIPIVLADRDEMEIPWPWLVVLPVSLILVSSLLKPYALHEQLLGATLVVFTGGVLVLALRDKLGEADVLYAASLAFVCSFPGFVVALVLACFGAFALYFSMALSTSSAYETPIPFTPLILWGFASQFLLFRGTL